MHLKSQFQSNVLNPITHAKGQIHPSTFVKRPSQIAFSWLRTLIYLGWLTQLIFNLSNIFLDISEFGNQKPLEVSKTRTKRRNSKESTVMLIVKRSNPSSKTFAVLLYYLCSSEQEWNKVSDYEQTQTCNHHFKLNQGLP